MDTKIVDSIVEMVSDRLFDETNFGPPQFDWFKGQVYLRQKQLAEWLTGNPRTNIKALINSPEFPTEHNIFGGDDGWDWGKVNQWRKLNEGR